MAHWPLALAGEVSDYVPTESLIIGGVTGASVGATATQLGGSKYAAVPYQPHLQVKNGLTFAYFAERADWSQPLVEGLIGKSQGYQIYQDQTTLSGRVQTVDEQVPALLTYDVSSLPQGCSAASHTRFTTASSAAP